MAIHTDDLSSIPEDLPEGNDRIVSGAAGNAEAVFERALRPKQLDEYVGQTKARAQLEIFISATRARQEALDHVLLFGPTYSSSCLGRSAFSKTASALPAEPLTMRSPFSGKSSGRVLRSSVCIAILQV